MQRGFLPAFEPLQRLPERFRAWDQLAADLPGLLCAGAARAAIARLPPLPADALEGEPELERALLLLSVFTNAFVWGDRWPAQGEEAKEKSQPPVIPRCVAEPLVAVARRLDRPPILSHASVVLHNWRRIDASRPPETGNTALLCCFLGGVDEAWFFLLTLEIEWRGAALCELAERAQAAVARSDTGEVLAALRKVTEVVERMSESLSRMTERCEPWVFYHRVRLFLSGWKGNADLPVGVVYEGCFDGQPQQFHGGSAAQSSLLPLLDALLGIPHASSFLRDMRSYMPRAHRQFLARIETGPSVRVFVSLQTGASARELTEAFDACVARVEAFRSRHVNIAALYIVAQARGKKAGETGTGGTPFMSFLKGVRDETAQARLGAGPG
jgi:indoleamine 2,3-dioxygenase